MFEPHHSEQSDAEVLPVDRPEGRGKEHAVQDRPEGFQLPGALWRAMFALYATFIASLALAAGGTGPARFMLVVSALFMLVYFSAATILAKLGGPDRETIGPAKPLQTIYGPLSAQETWIQVLLIPLALAIFGVSVLIAVSLAGA